MLIEKRVVYLIVSEKNFYGTLFRDWSCWWSSRL